MVTTMTEEDLLKRWSRRKREVAQAEQPAPPAAAARDPRSAPGDGVSDATAKKTDAEFDPATLPPIESITAISDVTAFLRAGVPVELTRAALRRVWTADPAIRDFVGLAENAWDFTDPTAMPGFGPLESTEDVRRMIAQVIDQIGEAARSEVTETDAPERNISETSNDSNVVDAIKPADETSKQTAPTQEQRAESQAKTSDNQVLLQSNNDDAAMQRDLTKDTREPKQLSHRIHGTALPR